MTALGLLCVHAHPDDESIATGGVLARAAGEGRRAAVVTCTDGALGEIVGEGMDADAVRPRLAELRRDELAAALRILDAGEPRFLGYRDSGMAGTAGNDDARSFWRAPFDEAVGRLVAEIRAFRPDVVVTYDAYGVYGHPDHVQAHRVTLVAAEAAAVAALYPDDGPAWRTRKVYCSTLPASTLVAFNERMLAAGLPSPFGETNAHEELGMGVADELITTAVDVSELIERKLAALAAHASQVSADSFFFNLPGDLQRMVFGTEWFVRVRGDGPDGEDDLFAGLG